MSIILGGCVMLSFFQHRFYLHWTFSGAFVWFCILFNWVRSHLFHFLILFISLSPICGLHWLNLVQRFQGLLPLIIIGNRYLFLLTRLSSRICSLSWQRLLVIVSLRTLNVILLHGGCRNAVQMFVAVSLFTPCLFFDGRFFLFNLVPNGRGASGRAIRDWCIPNGSMILLRGLERLVLRSGII